VRISTDKIKLLCKNKGLNVGSLLERASVSKTAFYSLVRKDDILPRSICSIASALDVSPLAFLEEDVEAIKARRLIKEADAIARAHPGLDRENVRHTLLMLSMEPIERLRRGLIRGRKIDIH